MPYELCSTTASKNGIAAGNGMRSAARAHRPYRMALHIACKVHDMIVWEMLCRKGTNYLPIVGSTCNVVETLH